MVKSTAFKNISGSNRWSSSRPLITYQNSYLYWNKTCLNSTFSTTIVFYNIILFYKHSFYLPENFSYILSLCFHTLFNEPVLWVLWYSLIEMKITFRTTKYPFKWDFMNNIQNARVPLYCWNQVSHNDIFHH